MSVANIAFFRQPLEPFTSLQQSSTSILTDKGGSRGGSLVSSSNNSGVDSAAGNRDAVGAGQKDRYIDGRMMEMDGT